MDEPKSLDILFEKKIFRIPDYQRGYAWQTSQLKDFWEDLINLPEARSHYTGVLTLKEVSSEEVKDSDNEFWLVDERSYRKYHKKDEPPYKMYHVVDGQQRLTTFVVFLQAFIECVKELDGNADKKADGDIYIAKGLSLADVISKYLFETKPDAIHHRTYKFGYADDEPSDEYLRHKIFKEDESSSIKDTFYTRNLGEAKEHFRDELSKLDKDGLQAIYKKLTTRFLFNEYIIKDKDKDAFDVFVAFEAMNNRGKHLSNLELLKNRLIYLTTLYSDDELDEAGRESLRKAIRGAWKEVYHQLGRNAEEPLNDDNFLRDHWIMYFGYSENGYSKFLLDEKFSPKRVHEKVEAEVDLEQPEEQRTDYESDDDTDSENGDTGEPAAGPKGRLSPIEIKNYVNSLKESAVHWCNSHYLHRDPHPATGLADADKEKDALDRLNRVGMVYFRPLVMSVLKNEKNPSERIDFWEDVERFIFIAFRLSRARIDRQRSIFYRASWEFNENKEELWLGTLEKIKTKLDDAMTRYCPPDGKFKEERFYDDLADLFKDEGDGYYGWYYVRYFLEEYEQSLPPPESKQTFKRPDDPKDGVSIEHIFPQKPKSDWLRSFAQDHHLYRGSIGNLLLLPKSINSSLKNADFKEKVKEYEKGSRSEKEVAQNDNWTPAEIEARGLKLLTFMEKRWKFEFKDEQTKEKLLFLPGADPAGED